MPLSDKTRPMTPQLAAAIAYWRGLSAPDDHIAARLGVSVADIAGADTGPPPALLGYPSSVAWADRTVSALVRGGLDRDNSAVVYFIAGEGAVTTGELRLLTAQCASALAAAGVGPGRPVAVDAAPRLESCLVVLAAMLLGAPVVRLAGYFDQAGFCALMRAAPAAVTISADADWANTMAEAGLCVGLDDSKCAGFEDWLEPHSDARNLPDVRVSPTDIALIGFTSGSTGAPKCVATSHEAVFRASEAMQSLFAFDRNDIFCTASNFSALSAFRSIFTMPLLCGGRALLPSPAAATSPLAMLTECRDYGVTRLTAVPALLRSLTALADRFGTRPMSALKAAFSGSGILDQPSCDRFVAAFGVPAIDYYGGREFATAVYADAGGISTVSSSGGLPVNCLLRVVDDSGRELPVGESGIVMVHSDSLMHDVPVHDKAGWAGWHDSGDVGQFDSGGRLRIVGRRRDIIKARDGTLIFPAEIESALLAITNVREAAVYGHTGPDGAEHIIAAVLLEATEENFATRAASLLLAAVGQMRLPSRIFTLADFPRVAAQKIDRLALRRLLEPGTSDL
jgi:acyl-coenzyme A synthetase/AMP-(fatty) acid ligase